MSSIDVLIVIIVCCLLITSNVVRATDTNLLLLIIAAYIAYMALGAIRRHTEHRSSTACSYPYRPDVSVTKLTPSSTTEHFQAVDGSGDDFYLDKSKHRVVQVKPKHALRDDDADAVTGHSAKHTRAHHRKAKRSHTQHKRRTETDAHHRSDDDDTDHDDDHDDVDEDGDDDGDMKYSQLTVDQMRPMAENIKNEPRAKYGEVFVDPSAWFPRAAQPPVCVTSNGCPVQPVYTNNTYIDLLEWDNSRRITPSYDMNLDYVNRVYNLNTASRDATSSKPRKSRGRKST